MKIKFKQNRIRISEIRINLKDAVFTLFQRQSVQLNLL
jgi:hypothetical protein